MAVFDGWAEYYDLIHQGLPGEAEFYVGNAMRQGGRTLELGCGTGRLSIPMAMSGVDVVGLDNSKAMLDCCREKLAEIGDTPGRLDLVQGDMRAFAFAGCFELAVIAYRTFMHLLTNEERRACLSAVHRHLAAGGVLMMNYWSPPRDHEEPELPSQVLEDATWTEERYAVSGTGDEVVVRHRWRCDLAAQRLEEEYQIAGPVAVGVRARRRLLSMERGWPSRGDMGELVRDCGFTVDALCGDFDCGPVTESSTERIWILRKA